MDNSIIFALSTFAILIISFIVFMYLYIKLKIELLGSESLVSIRKGFEYHDQFIGILFGKPENFNIYKPTADKLIIRYKFAFKVFIILLLLCLTQFVLIVKGT